MEGGLSENTWASRIEDNAMVARCAIVLGAILRALALLPVLQVHERHAGVLAAAAEVEARDR